MSSGSWREFVSILAAGLIVLTLVSWSAFVALQRDYAEAQHHEAQTQADEGRGGTQIEREWSALDAQWVTATSTFAQAVIGVFGLLGLSFTIWFSRLAWLESRESARQARRSATIAQKQLIDVRLATAVAQETDEGAARAYVSVVRAVYRPPDTHGEPFQSSTKKNGDILLTLENSGQTAAKNIVVRYTLTAEPPVPFVWDELGVAYRIPGSNLAPKQDPAGTLELYLLGPQVFAKQAAVTGDDTLAVLRGEVRYSDVFGRRHRTAFIYWVYRGLMGTSVTHDLSRERVRMPAFERVEIDPALED